MLDLLNQFFGWVLQLLPHSPFKSFISSIGNIPYLAELNWFVPVGEMIVIMEVWLAAIVVYYAYVGVLRLIRVIS